jgi:hypothetical protein
MVRCGFTSRKQITASKVMLNIDRVRTRSTVKAAFTFKVNTDFRRSQWNNGARAAEQSSVFFVHFHLIREFAHVGKQRRLAFGQGVEVDIGREMKVRCVFGAIIVADLPAIEVAQLPV